MKLLKTAAVFFIALIAIAPLNAQEDGDNIAFGKYRILKSKILDQYRQPENPSVKKIPEDLK